MKKRILSLFLAVITLFSFAFTGVYAADAASGLDLTVTPEIDGNTIKVSVGISSNPGVASMNIKMTYDKTLVTPSAVAKGSGIGTAITSNIQAPNVDLTSLKWVTAVFAQATNVEADTAEVAVFTFDINEGVESGDFTFVATCDDATDTNRDAVLCNAGEGTVTIAPPVEPDVPVDPDPVLGMNLSVSSAEAMQGEEFTVEVSVSENPGFAGVEYSIAFDNTKITPVSVALGDAADESMNFVSNIQDPYANKASFENVTGVFYGSYDSVNNGALAVYTFKASDSAAIGDTELVLSCGSANNQSLDSINVTCANGYVTILEKPAPEVETLTLTASASASDLKPGDTFEIAVTSKANPGFAGLDISLNFDKDVLTPVSVTTGGITTGLNLYSNTQDPSLDLSSLSKATAVLYNTTDVTDDGDIIVYTFTVKENAAVGSSAWNISCSSAYDQNGNELNVVTPSGSVNILKAENPNPPTPSETDFAFVVNAPEKVLPGVEFEVVVEIKNNPGFSGMKFGIEFDKNLLTPVSAEPVMENLLGLTFISNVSDPNTNLEDIQRVTGVIYGPLDTTTNGAVAVYKFKATDAAVGKDAELTLLPDENETINSSSEVLYIAGASATVAVTETEDAYVVLDKTSIDMKVDDTAVLTATVLPESVENKAVTWSSSDSSVVKVENGKLTALSAGTATITATAVDNGAIAECTVNVKKKPNPDEDFMFTADNPTAYSGKILEFNIYVKNNPGIAGATFDVHFNKEHLTPKKVAMNHAGFSTCVTNLTEPGINLAGVDTISVVLGNSGNIDISGKILTLVFDVKKTEVDIQSLFTINNFNVTNADGETFEIPDVNGVISILSNVPVEKVELDKTSTDIIIGESETLTATVLPENATNKNVTWSSSDESVATVENGVITTHKVGTATIKVTTVDGGHYAECTVNVKPIKVESVSLDKTIAEIENGTSVQLNALVLPENATVKDVTWSSDNTDAVTVENGLVKAVGVGYAKVTVTTVDGGFTAECNITVCNNRSDFEYSINNGIVTIDKYIGENTVVIVPTSIDGAAVKVIGSAAFAGTEIVSVVLPKETTSIGDNAFNGCNSIVEINIPAKVNSIGATAFTSANSLTSINVEAGSVNYCSVDGVLFNKSKTTIMCYPMAKAGASYDIPATVKTVATSAFMGTALESVTIPDGVAEIKSFAFKDSAITEITLPASATALGDGVFASCSALTSINVNEANTAYISINGVMFNKDQTNLVAYPAGKTDASYSVAKNITAIGKYAFNGCTNLNEVVIINTLTKIGDNAFEGCSELNAVYFYGTKDEWDNVTIGTGNEVLDGIVEFRLFGDVDMDGKVAIQDLVRLAQYLANWDVNTDALRADCDGDGKVAIQDLVRLAQYLANWDVNLGKK